MPFATRTKVATGSSGDVTATHDNGSPLSSAYGHFALVKRTTATQPSTPAGWTYVGGTVSSSTAIWLYRARGDGTINSFTIPSATTATVVLLQSFPAYADDFADLATFLNGTGTSRASGTLTATEDGQYAVAMIALNSSAGGTGIAWSGSYTLQAGGSSGSSYGWADKDISTSGTDATVTATWTTNRNYAMAVVLVKTTSPVQEGTGSGAFSWAGSSAGSIATTGSATGAVSFAGSATGSTSKAGTGAATASWAASATGSRQSSGGATGAHSWSGSAAGSTVRAGTGSAGFSWAGSAAATSAPSGSATGAFVWVASATGDAPADAGPRPTGDLTLSAASLAVHTLTASDPARTLTASMPTRTLTVEE